MTGLFSTGVAFADLSDQIKLAAKNAALDQFVETMKDGPFYKITTTETSLVRLKSGHEAVEVQITFDDSRDCRGRVHVTVCEPLDANTMFCGYALTNCHVETISSGQEIQLTP